MKILFCNITYMNHYIGQIDQDVPQGGGAWVKKHKDAHEKWNFLNVNGKCYGFAMNKGDQFHIERIEGVSRQDMQAENVTVVWCASKSGETVIVGWYENATVYRYFQDSFKTPVGLGRDYFVEANANDCYLLPEERRTYTIGRASVDGTGTGFGQNNFWYADSQHAKEHIVPEVAAYLQTQKNYRINKTKEAFLLPENWNVPLSPQESGQATAWFNDGEYMNYLPLGYRAYHQEPSGDHAYCLAAALKELHQYSEAINWFNQTIEIEGDSWEVTSNLPYLLMECGRYAEAVNASEKLLNFREVEEADVKHEIYGMLADNWYNLGDTKTAVSWLDKIIAESEDLELVAYTRQTRSDWLKF